MIAKVILFSRKPNEINDFLNKFYSKNLDLDNSLSWQQHFSNPVDITELIATFVDGINLSDMTMWISLDEDVYIKITSSNADNVIKYIFERYPY